MAIPFAGVFERLRGLFHRGEVDEAPSATAAAIIAAAGHKGGAAAADGGVAAVATKAGSASLPPLQKPSSEKLSKTVMPNTTRTIAPLDPFQVAAGAGSNRAGGAGGLRSGNGLRAGGLPPAVALALEPKVERTITLTLGDLLAGIPAGYLKPVEQFEPSRRILLKAAEVEKGMAKGSPAVSLASVYEQAPEIFLKSVTATDMIEVALPFEKVMQAFDMPRVRNDQQRDQAVPQVETPFLQATIEDSEKFGIEIGPLETCEMPPVRVQPASARALAEAEPEVLFKEMTSRAAPPSRTTIKLTESIAPTSRAAAPGAGTPPPAPSTPSRIPFQLPPNGTGEPASERVPASSGPSVPIRSDNPTAARIPFRIDAPSDTARPKVPLPPNDGGSKPAAEPIKLSAAAAGPRDDSKVSLPLRVVLQNIPAFQLKGDPRSVETNRRIELPLALVQPQLATGKVAVPPKVFQAAMPEEFRELLLIDDSETPIMLPLQEVLANLPGAALQIRPDQEEAEKGEQFETPIAAKAREDAERFKAGAQPVAKTATAETPEKPAAAEAKREEPPEDQIEGKDVVARATALPGVAGCSVTFTDGLMLAGNFPDDVAVDALCAVAPSLLKRIEQHMEASKLGALSAMTLHGENKAVTFFTEGNICVTALHDGTELVASTQAELAQMTKRLARTYAQPESVHVDH